MGLEKKVHLSKRLQMIADLMSFHTIIADIGCDHGYVSIYMIQNKIADRVIAMDIRKGPLKRAEENIKKYHCNHIETRLSDGAKELKEKEVQAILISGMGGGLMIKILSESQSVICNLQEMVLQPQSELEEVRRYLEQIGFVITKEQMTVEDGKYYTALQVQNGLFVSQKSRFASEKTLEKQKEVEYRYGKYLLMHKDEILFRFLQKELKKYQMILQQLEQSDLQRNQQKYLQMKQEYQLCQEGLKYYESK